MNIFFYCVLLIGIFVQAFDLSAMINNVDQKFPTLRSLSAQAYWKQYNELPTKQINNEIKEYLIMYAPMQASTIVEQLKYARDLNDIKRIAECEKFMVITNAKEKPVKVFLEAFKTGFKDPDNEIEFDEIKNEQIQINIDQTNCIDKSHIDVNKEYRSEKNAYVIGKNVGDMSGTCCIACSVMAVAGCILGIPMIFVYYF